jgi:ABC-type anion transport system duplicated permease subunit
MKTYMVKPAFIIINIFYVFSVFILCLLSLLYYFLFNPWLRHSNHPQEKEGGPKKTRNLKI